MSDAFSMPIVPRYAEIDQQGVVFNAHYLTWFDEASTAFLDYLGVPITEFPAWALDVQVVHTEIDFAAPVRWGDAVCVETSCEAAGTTSYTLRFVVMRRDAEGVDVAAVRGRTVYVVVSTDDWTKRAIPPGLRDALTSVAGQGRITTDATTAAAGSGDGTVTP